MKRINLSVNMDDNEMLNKSIEEALKARARQIARETLTEELVSEIERITDARVREVKESAYYNQITNRIVDIMVKRLGSELTVGNHNINKMIEEKVTDYINTKLTQRGGIEPFLQSYIDKSIANVLVKKANDLMK